MKRNVYLDSADLKDIPNILEKLLKETNFKRESIQINTKESLGKITSSSIYANASSPSYNASAMDGVAVLASITLEATESNPITIKNNEFEVINTGNILPGKYDAVIMIEDIEENNDGSITIIKSVSSFENVRPIGEDIVLGELVLPKYHRIKPIDISGLLSAQINKVDTVKLPRVLIIPTGDEIVNTDKIEKGKIIDSNSYYKQNRLLELGINADISPVQKDNYESLKNYIISKTVNYDLILIGAGSSAGTKDFAKAIIEQNGKVYCHGINIKPGKPTIIGSINNTPLIGMPGYPVSTYIAFEEVVKPLIELLTGIKKTESVVMKAKIVKKVYSSLKNHEFVRVRLGFVNNQLVAVPLDRKAGVTMSLIRADGILKIDKNCEGYEAGSIVDVRLIKNIAEIRNNLTIIGSHDIMFDVLESILIEEDINVSSSHVGSYGGVNAIKCGQCNIAPVHMLSNTGEYNTYLIEKYLDKSFKLIKGVSRKQGFYVKKGNPKKIKKISDLQKSDINFVNRQRGSGTRILFDKLLKDNFVEPKNIHGYLYELPSHVLVAESVKDERFDVGLGIESVANMFGLEFIELGLENYDFIVNENFIDSPMFHRFIRAIKSDKFKEKLTKIGGYLFDNIGKEII